MKYAIVNTIRQTDYLLNSAYLGSVGERKALIIFLFHAIFRNTDEAKANVIEPPQGMLLEHFCQFIEYYQAHQYTFVSPEDILKGLDKHKNYCLIAFDDGYFNNSYVLPVLKKYKTPAAFFISTDYVKNNQAFWWDAFYREKRKTGVSGEALSAQVNLLMSSKSNEIIEQSLIDEFGKHALKPIGDIDRPFTPEELKNFAKEDFVSLGNHTSSHPYLPNCSADQIKSTILAAQNDLCAMTSTTPVSISYPHGAYNENVIKISKDAGLKLGITVDDHKNYLPINFGNDDPLRLGRFALQDNDQLIRQCQFCRTDIRLTKVIKKLIGAK